MHIFPWWVGHIAGGNHCWGYFFGTLSLLSSQVTATHLKFKYRFKIGHQDSSPNNHYQGDIEYRLGLTLTGLVFSRHEKDTEWWISRPWKTNPYLIYVINKEHYNDVIMSELTSEITSLTRILLNGLFRPRSNKTSKLRVTGLCEGVHRGPVNSPHRGPVTRKIFPFDDVIMDKCGVADGPAL